MYPPMFAPKFYLDCREKIRIFLTRRKLSFFFVTCARQLQHTSLCLILPPFPNTLSRELGKWWSLSALLHFKAATSTTAGELR